MIKEMLLNTLSIIAPYSCLVCDRRSQDGIICKHCLPPFLPIQGSRSIHLWEYEGKAAKIITQAKYKPSAALCVKLGQILGRALREHNFHNQFELAVPIPPSPAHLVSRGFSHTGLIASATAGILKLGVAHSALVYSGSSIPQVGLSNLARKENMKGAFRAKLKLVRDRRILLIDDVITTGATIDTAKQALIEAGASAVAVATLAKVKS